MAWIILEGLDRTGKTSVAELYKRQGYEIVHMSAPNKKYAQAGYTGPSYLDELLDVYMRYAGKDVIFDRSGYGEFIWPFVYNRKAQLSDEDIEVLQDIENQNDVQRILMYDPNVEAHWKRCVDNNEPLTRPQFNQASVLFDKMSRKYSFDKKQLSDFSGLQKSVLVQNAQPAAAPDVRAVETASAEPNLLDYVGSPGATTKSKEQAKLEKANAINDILAKRIIKQKGEMYDLLEKDIRDFLNTKLSTIFGENETKGFTPDEVQILKIYVKQLKQKLEGVKK